MYCKSAVHVFLFEAMIASSNNHCQDHEKLLLYFGANIVKPTTRPSTSLVTVAHAPDRLLLLLRRFGGNAGNCRRVAEALSAHTAVYHNLGSG